jgi:putative membrane protein
MSSIATVAVFLVIVLHVGFFVLESVMWARPLGRKIFELSAEDAEATKVLAMNQGFYNLGVAVMLCAALYRGHTDATIGLLLFLFFMGLVGGFTANKSILLVQSLPAAAAAAAVAYL